MQLVNELTRNRFTVCDRDAKGALYWAAQRVPPDRLPAFPHFQPNTEKFVNVITIDLDTFDANRICRALGPLMPNMLVQDKESGRGHAMYFLEKPVGMFSPAVIQYVRDIHERLKRHIDGADPSGVALTGEGWAKNPLSDHWRTHVLHDTKFTLDFLNSQLAKLPRQNAARFSGNYTPTFGEGSRNDDLFEVLRRQAYWAWVYGGNKLANSAWIESVKDMADFINAQMPDPLPTSEVHATAKSVAKFYMRKGYTRRFNPKWNIGVMGFAGNGMSLSEKCAAAADRTNQVRASMSAIKVQTARASHPAANKSEITRITGLSRTTVLKYWDSASQSDNQTVPSVSNAPARSSRTSTHSSPPSTSISPDLSIHPDKRRGYPVSGSSASVASKPSTHSSPPSTSISPAYPIHPDKRRGYPVSITHTPSKEQMQKEKGKLIARDIAMLKEDVRVGKVDLHHTNPHALREAYPNIPKSQITSIYNTPAYEQLKKWGITVVSTAEEDAELMRKKVMASDKAKAAWQAIEAKEKAKWEAEYRSKGGY